MTKAVIIDFDDTLCLTEAACFEVENEALRQMGRRPMSRSVHVSTWGQPLFDAITTRSPGIDVEAFKVAYHPIIAEYTKAGKYDEIAAVNYEALDKLAERGRLLFILTSRTRGEITHLLASDHKLAVTIKAFYYKENMQYHKPDPRAFAGLLSSNGFKPEECVYIGDSVSDAIASKEAGLKFIASLESGLRQKSDFNPRQVDKFVYKFPDVINAIAELESE